MVVVNNVSNKGKAFLYENLKEAVSLIIAVFKQTRLKKSMQPRHVKSLLLLQEWKEKKMKSIYISKRLTVLLSISRTVVVTILITEMETLISTSSTAVKLRHVNFSRQQPIVGVESVLAVCSKFQEYGACFMRLQSQ